MSTLSPFTALRRALTGPVGPVGPEGAPGPAGSPGVGVPHLALAWVPDADLDTEDGQFPPTRAHAQDAGWDLTTPYAIYIPTRGRVVVDTGWAIESGLPAGTVGMVRERSGHAAKYGLQVLGGVIDPGYTGTLKVILHNTGQRPVRFRTGDRIAQLVVHQAYTGEGTSVRGGAGLGSTGNSAQVQVPAPAQEDQEDYSGLDTMEDVVDHPAHYANHAVFSGEAWDYTQHTSFGTGNVFKYSWRAPRKGNMSQDLRKARWYATHTPNLARRSDISQTAVKELHNQLYAFTNKINAASCGEVVKYITALDQVDGMHTPYPVYIPTSMALLEQLAQLEAATACVMVADNSVLKTIAALDRAIILADRLAGVSK